MSNILDEIRQERSEVLPPTKYSPLLGSIRETTPEETKEYFEERFSHYVGEGLDTDPNHPNGRFSPTINDRGAMLEHIKRSQKELLELLKGD